MKNKRSKTTRRRRGTIIILVVAVLALLAVIGTIYIISARTERAAANAAATNVNMVLAERAAMNSVVEIIGNAMYDSAGNVGGYDATTGTYGTLAARNYDFPDSPPLNLANSALDLVDPATGATMLNGSHTSMRGQPWLAPTLHNNSLTAFQTTSSATAGDSYLTYNVFDPYTAKYDIFTPSATSPGVPPNVVDDQTLSTVDPFVPANPSANPDGINPNTTQPPDAYWNLLPFSEASGIHYRYAIRILDTSRMANLNIGSVDDATAKGDTTGTYITSYDLAPAAGVITDGAFFNQLDNTGSNLARNLHVSAAGRAGTSGIAYTDLASWQKQFAFHIEALLPPASGAVPFDLSDELELRSYGEYGTTYHARPAMEGANALWPNTLSGDNNKSTASGTVIGNPARRNYTTYSFSRDIRPYADPTAANPLSKSVIGPFTLTPTGSETYPSNFPGFNPVGGNTATGAMNIWPPSPARINPNPDITSMSDNDAVFTIAAAATNMATAMTLAGYGVGPPEYYAANYVAQRCNCYAQDTTVTDGTLAYYLPHGPSYLDGQGICVRSRTQGCPSTETGSTILDCNFAGANNLVTPKALNGTSLTQVYLGYAAQPFVSEVAVEAYTWDNNAGTGNPVPDLQHAAVGWAVVLYNPYNQAISLQGFTLRYQGIRINLGTTAGGKNYVPANGYAILYSPLNLNTTDATPKVIKVPPTLLIQQQFNTGANINMIQCLPIYNPSGVAAVTLERAFYDRTETSQIYPVELYEFGNNSDVRSTPPAAITSAAGTVFCTWEKNWSPAVNPWAITIGAPATGASGLNRNEGLLNPTSPTLGPPNPNVTVAAASTTGVHLYDRNFDAAVTEGAAARKNFTSFTDFNHIMQTGNSNDDTGTANQNHYTLTFNLAGNIPAPAQFAGLAANDAFAAQIYFDLSPDAKIYSVLPPADGATKYGDVDASAYRLMDCITFIDRVSDPTIDLLNLPNNGSKLDINKIRLPGKININTASGDVLRALPGIQLMANPNQVVANILAYRVRASTATPVTYNGTPSNKDYSAQANYPGVGFRSLAEVTIPIYDALGGRPPVDNTVAFDKSDASWSSIYNLCTVRSDTFVVYGYLEAVENGQNLANNNGNAWYNSIASDNPTLGGPSLIRLSRLRWVAIVDRSFCNYPVGSPNFQMPRIVAIRDLPK